MTARRSRSRLPCLNLGNPCHPWMIFWTPVATTDLRADHLGPLHERPPVAGPTELALSGAAAHLDRLRFARRHDVHTQRNRCGAIGDGRAIDGDEVNGSSSPVG